MAVDLEGLITIREAARECHRSTETVRRWVWDGKLPAEKVGNHLFVKRSDLNMVCKRTPEETKRERLALLDEIDAIRERIRLQIGGDIDAVRAVDESRESHPKW